ncbi:hypothetical protein LZ31DRAFT_548776, partial [Colletotrichum somersetense]
MLQESEEPMMFPFRLAKKTAERHGLGRSSGLFFPTFFLWSSTLAARSLWAVLQRPGTCRLYRRWATDN